MLANDAKAPLLSREFSSNPPQKPAFVKRRYRRTKSAPVNDGIVNDGVLPQVNTQNLPSMYAEKILLALNPSLRQVILFLTIYLGIGTLCFYLVRNQINGRKTNGVLDAVYFCIVTMTTVGYGDLVPNSVAAKLLACIFVFSGMAVIGLLLSNAADYLIEKQETLIVKTLNVPRRDGALKAMKEMEENRVKYKFITVTALLAVLIIIGTVFLSKVEKLSLVDSFYCVCSTITTLGYGDKSFSSFAGRSFAVVWILASTICLARFFLYMAELNTEKRRHSLVKWVLTRRMSSADLEAADFDDDGVVSAAEFVLFKLKEMGKIGEEDIAPCMEEFEELDFDNSGTLSVSDLILAQGSQQGS